MVNDTTNSTPSVKSVQSVDKTRDPRTYAIIGAAMEVHRQLGGGFLEAVYQEAMGIELRLRNVPHRAQVELPVHYKGQRLACDYRADFVCDEAVIVEIKALSELAGVHEAQVINYLKATGMQAGLLINFGAASLAYRRFAGPKNGPPITQCKNEEME